MKTEAGRGSRRGGILVALAGAGLLAAALACGRAGPAGRGPERADAGDALVPLLYRMDLYFQRHEREGVAMDWRYRVDPAEETRQTVVCQLLGYAEIDRVLPTRRTEREITDRADFLVRHLDAIRSHTAFDGLLAYGLLAAYEVGGRPRDGREGVRIARELGALPPEQCVLNGGLMAALAIAKAARVTGDPALARRAHGILAEVAGEQNEDGSFPHWCSGSRDVHYTAWMAMELIHLKRMLDDPRIDPMLARMSAFLERHVGDDGRTRYEDTGPDSTGRRRYAYSRASGCAFDYDTRGWTVEPAYCALVFDAQRSPRWAPTLKFLLSLERGGTFADQYDHRPPPDDPEYPWTVADTSVVNMSIIFWALATDLAVRASRART
ncbi:MAG TPA: hypothetical protein VI792_02675 [Candidatus Eisenbacteria bacterium]